MGASCNSLGRKSVTLLIPSGFASAAIIHTGSIGTGPFICTFGVDITDSEFVPVDAANSIFDNWADAILPEMTQYLTLDRVILTVGSNTGNGSVESTRTALPGGVAAGDYPPRAQSAIIRKSTAQLGRAGRGRMFVPGVLDEPDVGADGILDPVRQAELTSAFIVLLGALADDTSEGQVSTPMRLLHSSNETPSVVLGMACANKVGWVRGRIR
uniref:Uncharacterized protein n=1 Tax=uncultured prokaryote TaxID=198431 RepID=A0A0H5QNA8_9ZZZZ|nr:hypothetical protein [uncultured prokaryote]